MKQILFLVIATLAYGAVAEPITTYRTQGKMYKSSSNVSNAYGAYSAETYTFSNVAGATTDANIVSAVAGRRIRVISYSVSAVTAGGTSITFNSKPGGAGTAITNLITLNAGVNAHADCEAGLFQTAVGQGLTATTGTNGVGLHITYVLMDQ